MSEAAIVIAMVSMAVGACAAGWFASQRRLSLPRGGPGESVVERLQSVSRDSRVLLAVLDDDMSFRWLSGGGHLSLDRTGVVGAAGGLIQLVHPQDAPGLLGWAQGPIFAPGAEARRTTQRQRLLGADGDWLEHELTLVDHRDATAQPGYALVAVDCSALAREVALREEAAVIDALTELPNRMALIRDLAAADRSSPAGTEWTLVILSVRNVASVNARFTVTTGDDLIRSVGAQVAAASPESSRTYRIGGTTFAGLISGRADTAIVAATALLDRLGEPIPTRSGSIVAECVAGLAHADPYETGISGLLSDAYEALACSKAAQNGRMTTFAPRMRVEMAERKIRREALLHSAENDLAVRLRPITDVRGRVWGQLAEPSLSLSERELLVGRALLDEGETHGLRLTQNVVEEALRASAPRSSAPLAITLSYESLRRASTTISILEAVARSGRPCSSVLLVVGERAVTDPRARQAVIALRNLGFGVVLDGFGDEVGSLTALTDRIVDWIRVSVPGSDDLAGAERLAMLLDCARTAHVRVMACGANRAGRQILAGQGVERFDDASPSPAREAPGQTETRVSP